MVGQPDVGRDDRVLGTAELGAYALITNITRKPLDTRPGTDEPVRILDQRLARGEIDAEEYQRLRDLITTGEHHSPAGTGSPR